MLIISATDYPLRAHVVRTSTPQDRHSSYVKSEISQPQIVAISLQTNRQQLYCVGPVFYKLSTSLQQAVKVLINQKWFFGDPNRAKKVS